MLQKLNIMPGTRGELMLRNRLLGSTEPWSTFALANSLAGYIAGPFVILLAVGLYNLVRADAPGSRWTALAMAAPLVLVVLVCLLLGKSRSAGFGVAAEIMSARGARRGGGVSAVLLAIGLSARLWSPAWWPPVWPCGGSTRKSSRNDEVDAHPCGILAGRLGGDRQRSASLASALAGRRSGGASGPAISRALTPDTSCRRPAKRSSTRTTCSSKSGRRGASWRSYAC